jgi:glycine cleavage system H protein
MTVPGDLRYTAEHEWVAIKDTTATIGITAYAAEALGDVVYVSAPAAGTTVQAGEPCGEVESVKSVSDIYSPVDGEVIEVNDGVEEDPGVVNADPYGEGWLFKVQLPGAAGDPAGLLSPDEYSALTAEGQE